MSDLLSVYFLLFFCTYSLLCYVCINNGLLYVPVSCISYTQSMNSWQTYVHNVYSSSNTSILYFWVLYTWCAPWLIKFCVEKVLSAVVLLSWLSLPSLRRFSFLDY